MIELFIKQPDGTLLSIGKIDLSAVTGAPGEVITPSYGANFEEFWKVYPRKVGKGGAWRCWQKQKAERWAPQILKAVAAYKQTEQWRKDGGQFIPHASTWLNQRRWEDELPGGTKDALIAPLRPVAPRCQRCNSSASLALEDFLGRKVCCFCRAELERQQEQEPQEEWTGEE